MVVYLIGLFMCNFLGFFEYFVCVERGIVRGKGIVYKDNII